MASGNITIKPRLLWKNPTPSASFAAQELSLPSNNCSFFLVIPSHQSNDQSIFQATIVVPGLGGGLFCTQGKFNGYIGEMSAIIRRITASTQTSITFETANVIDKNGTVYTDRDDLAIPYEIYGI